MPEEAEAEAQTSKINEPTGYSSRVRKKKNKEKKRKETSKIHDSAGDFDKVMMISIIGADIAQFHYDHYVVTLPH